VYQFILFLFFLQISILTMFYAKGILFHETGYSQNFCIIIIFPRGSNSGKLQVTSNVFNLERKLELTWKIWLVFLH
jgi:hypothetical protein